MLQSRAASRVDANRGEMLLKTSIRIRNQSAAAITKRSFNFARTLLTRIAAVASFWGTTYSIAAAAETVIVIEHCSVFDSIAEQMRADQTIIIQGDQITAVGDARTVADIPANAKRIDGRGKFAIPGLIDAHVHLVHGLVAAHVTGDEVLPLFMAAGVTSVRCTGDELVAGKLVSRYAADHPESCPRVFTCSPLLDADPPYHKDIGRGVADPSQVRGLFDDLTKWEIRTVKIYAGTPRPIGRAIIDEAHRHGLFVTGHLGFYSAQDAVADGIDGLEHIWSVFDYSIPADAVKDPLHRSRLDLGNPKCEALVAELAKQKIYVDPTLTVHRNLILFPDLPEIRDSPDNLQIPRRLREYWPKYATKNGIPAPETLDHRRGEFAKYQELTGKLYRAGVPIQVGTDSPEPYCPPGLGVHQELERLVESGLPPAAAISAATITNATSLGEKERIGSISPGKQADIVLLSASPLEEIRNTRKIELVLHAGHVSKPADLLQLVPQD